MARPHSRGVLAPTAVHPGLIDLTTGNPDPALLPRFDAALRSLDTGPRLYDEPQHLPSLMQFVAAEFASDGVPAGGIALVSGGIDGIERILREHLRAGDHVALEDPGLPVIHDLMHASGYVVVPLRVDREGPDPEALAGAMRKRCRALIVTARAQNPCGAALTEGRVRDLRSVLRPHPEVLLIENDPYGPIAGVPLVTLCDGNRQRWAHIRSTSKFLGPDMRVAFVTGDTLTVDRVSGRFALGPRRVSPLLQQLVLALWSDPAAGRQLARAAEIYRQRQSALVDALAARGISASGSSGFNVWVSLKAEARAVHDLASFGFAVAAGEPFRIVAAPGIRITTSTLLPADAGRLAEAVVSTLQPARRPPA